MTENQEAFLAFALDAAKAAGMTPKAGAEMKGFVLGVKTIGLHSRYQEAKREAANAPEPGKPVRKARRVS